MSRTAVEWVALACAALLSGMACGPPEAGRTPGSGEEADPATSDTARATYRFFVRVAPGSDPGAVAADHGVRPDTVLTGRNRAFRASLTKREAARLRGDTRVRSVSVRVEGEGWRPEGGRTLPTDSPDDTSASGRPGR